MMRREYLVPRSLAMPLLRATEQFLNYRNDRLVMYARSRYIGRARASTLPCADCWMRTGRAAGRLRPRST